MATVSLTVETLMSAHRLDRNNGEARDVYNMPEPHLPALIGPSKGPMATQPTKGADMKTILVVSAAALLAVASPTFAQSVPEKTGMNSALGIAPKTQDFVTLAAQSDMLEIQSSKLALTKSDSSKTKAFADKMIKDHTETSNELKALVSSGKVQADVPAALDKAHIDKFEKLTKQSDGKDFTKDYNSMQVSAHKDAVSMFERYGKEGDNADLKAFANKYLPHLQEHLTMAQDLDK